MDDGEWLATRFEQHRPRLRGVACRMLGSLADADDAVQDAWLRLSQSEAGQIENLAGWLTTVVARECLHMLRSRRRRREETVGAGLPDPIVVPDGAVDPEQEVLLSDSVGLALLIVLDYLSPAERLAFVLHDMFDLPFDDIAQLIGRSPAAARQLASRARRRVQGAELPAPNSDLQRQRQVVDAFFAAGRAGDFVALAKLLDPDVVLRADFGGGRPLAVFRGVSAVAKQAREPVGAQVRPVLVNGTVGRFVTIHGRPHSILAFTVVNGKILKIDGIADPHRVSRIATAILTEDSWPLPAQGRPTG